ncbi:MAG: nucleoside-diphosphate kinase [Candidatus Eremiobacteraeota bacterium]|nr:nucleoside-diphosphate kinase [Candidatus Eremiobacteraeota bacterium]
MAVEQTLILCKADAVQRGLVGEIISRFERRGYVIAAMKLLRVEESRAKEHYAEHEGKPFFPGLIAYIMSDPIVAMVVSGESAIEGCRQAIGATDPRKAAPGTIRADLAQTIGRNLVHGSDSPASAKREIAIWFEPREIAVRPHPLESSLISD